MKSLRSFDISNTDGWNAWSRPTQTSKEKTAAKTMWIRWQWVLTRDCKRSVSAAMRTGVGVYLQFHGKMHWGESTQCSLCYRGASCSRLERSPTRKKANRFCLQSLHRGSVQISTCILTMQSRKFAWFGGTLTSCEYHHRKNAPKKSIEKNGATSLPLDKTLPCESSINGHMWALV